jgi:hypothetical protein
MNCAVLSKVTLDQYLGRQKIPHRADGMYSIEQKSRHAVTEKIAHKIRQIVVENL